MLRSSRTSSYRKPLHNHLLAPRRLSYHSHSSYRGRCVSSSSSSSSSSPHTALSFSPFKTTTSASSLYSSYSVHPIEKNFIPQQAFSLSETLRPYRRVRTPSSFLREGGNFTSSHLCGQSLLTCLRVVSTTSPYPGTAGSTNVRSNTTLLLFFHSSSPRRHSEATGWLHTCHRRLSESVHTPQQKGTAVVSSKKEPPPATVNRGTSSTRISSGEKKGKKRSLLKKCVLGVLLLGSSVLAVGIAVDTNDHLKQLLAAR